MIIPIHTKHMINNFFNYQFSPIFQFSMKHCLLKVNELFIPGLVHEKIIIS